VADRRERSFFLPMLGVAGGMLLAALCFVPFLRCPDFRHTEKVLAYSSPIPPCSDCRDGRISLKGLWGRHRNTARITYGK
jgi:hypothetical protein